MKTDGRTPPASFCVGGAVQACVACSCLLHNRFDPPRAKAGMLREHVPTVGMRVSCGNTSRGLCIPLTDPAPPDRSTRRLRAQQSLWFV